MRIIGLSQFEPYEDYYHDTGIAYVRDGIPRFASLEERFSRIKHHAGYPAGALRALQRLEGVQLHDADIIAVPETYLASSGCPRLVTNIGTVDWPLAQLMGRLDPKKVHCCDHQLAHASVAYRLSPFDEALVLSLDGEGYDCGRATFGGVFLGKANSLERLRACWSDGNSVGLFYGLVTEALGWRMSDGEGKTMGLAAYGDPAVLYAEVRRYAPSVQGLDLVGGHRFAPNSLVVNHQHLISDPSIGALRELADRAGRENLAAAAQAVLEELLEDWVRALLAAYPTRQVCLGGGVFMNVAANAHLARRFPDVSFFVPPSPGDGGIALGAALELAAQNGAGRVQCPDAQYLGMEWGAPRIEAALAGWPEWRHSPERMAKRIAQRLAEGAVVGLYHGRSEWGPRALGNRSVIAHPGWPGIRDRINNLMKRRESFMPFAPAVLTKRCGDCFLDPVSPYMMSTTRVRREWAEGRIDAVLHRDGTARAQAVEPEMNTLLASIISEFEQLTGIPMVLNTSFNLHGHPMVERPEEAMDHLSWGCVDELAIGGRLLRRN